jgi:hypothetical protein
MTRREFPSALAAVVASPGFLSAAAPEVVTLQAIAGVRLPETLLISTNSPDRLRSGVWELRIYRGAASGLASHFAGVFPRVGIRPFRWESAGESLAYLIPFENLTARDCAWTRLNADPAWMRAHPRFESYHFGLYRPL